MNYEYELTRKDQSKMFLYGYYNRPVLWFQRRYSGPALIVIAVAYLILDREFNFLGFTHYWGRSRKGIWVVKRKTEGSRFTRALRTISEWCNRNRHRSLAEQREALGRKLRGHFAYYGITGNARSLCNFRFEVQRVWRKWLSRRSRAQPMPWERFNALLARCPLPPARVLHSCYAAKL